MSQSAFTIRPAKQTDLEALNAVIRAAIMNWNLPERVKRLSIPSYLYDQHDLQHMSIMVAEDSSGKIVATAAWETAPSRDLPSGHSGLLLHGIFVRPEQQQRGIGGTLLQSAERAVREQQLDGLLVKAQTDAVEFFIAQGMEKLPIADRDRDYENRFWKTIS